ncbi:MAG: DoxX family protein [Chlamydiales bacterium]|nr:DoxX family protein [Chlamydiales bacterium]
MHFLLKSYAGIVFLGNKFQTVLLLLLRLYWGPAFFISGLGKFGNISNVIDFFASLNIPYPAFSAYLTAGIECVGGLCLLFGLLSRLAAIPLVVITLSAMLTDNISEVKNVLNDPQNLISQLPFSFFLVALIIFSFGPGKWSLDYLFKKRFCTKNKPSN